MAARLSEPISDLVTVADKLRADDRLITDSGTLLGNVESLADTITVLESVLVAQLAEARRIGATIEHYGRGPRSWLTEDVLMAGAEASRYVNLAKGLDDLPLVREAFSHARLSAAHANEIVKAMRWLPIEYRDEVEPHIVDYAFTCRPEEIAAFIEKLLDALGLDKASDVRRERRYAERGLDVGQTMDGRRTVIGTLTPEIGEKLEKALAVAAGKAGEEDDRTLRQRQHDALGAICDTYLANTGTPNRKGATRTVFITMDLATLENQLREQWVTLPSGAQISPDTARRLACEAGIIPVVLGGKGEMLDIGQPGQEFSAAVRRAAWFRDQGKCAFPGCGNTPIELHHIVFRRHLGPASLDNAAWLCGFHHRLVHEGNWKLQRLTDDDGYRWTGPHGQQRIRRLSTA